MPSGIRFAVPLDRIELIHPAQPGQRVHGANLTIRSWIKAITQDDRTEAMELYLRPSQMPLADLIQEAAADLVPPGSGGRGRLEVLPLFSLADRWADGRERALFLTDPIFAAPFRSLRDRHAAGPTPLLIQTHSLGHDSLSRSLAPLASADPVPGDTIMPLSRTLAEGLERWFSEFLSPKRPMPL
ncbi:MAG: hypothetical protein MH204_02980, partial [Fimbriimonadaceae bacterium]|nr:hypothetical protein [Fimbriimonadaceae bacterium]